MQAWLLLSKALPNWQALVPLSPTLIKRKEITSTLSNVSLCSFRFLCISLVMFYLISSKVNLGIGSEVENWYYTLENDLITWDRAKYENTAVNSNIWVSCGVGSNFFIVSSLGIDLLSQSRWAGFSQFFAQHHQSNGHTKRNFKIYTLWKLSKQYPSI